MGFSVAAAYAIIGVSFLISLEILTGSMLPALTNVDESYNSLFDRKIEGIQTSINISKVSVEMYNSNYNHSITIKNIGKITLKTNEMIVLINGLLQDFESEYIYFYPGESILLNVSDVSGDGNQRLKIITYNGISDYYSYYI
ncbi:MAG: hypothetical protein R6V50_08105 [Thermoplasmatota archaeon]